jgi:putative ABC transport system permease protein
VLTFNVIPTELAMFGLYGLEPVAGALPSQVTVFPRGASGYVGNAPYVLNDTAARQMGFSSPAAAVGRTISTRFFGGPVEANRVLAVVPDFSMMSVERQIGPMAYVVDPGAFRLISVKLAPGDLGATLAAIDRVWQTTNPSVPMDRFFLDDHLRKLYVSLLNEARAFGMFSVVALLLGCIGLLALATLLARRRTREFGIRKAMGADTRDIVQLLLWHFAKPVFLANLIAWPITGVIMNRWLHGFAYHTDLDPLLFAAAGAMALLIALLAVAAQSVRVARASPAETLRYQ